MSMEGFSDGQAAEVLAPERRMGLGYRTRGRVRSAGGKAGTAPACHTFHLAELHAGECHAEAQRGTRSIGPSSADG